MNTDEKTNDDIPKPDHHHKIEELLEKNLELTAEILRLTEKNNRVLRMQKYWGFIKFLIILIPIVFGIIYLPPLIEEVFNFYKDMLGLDGVKDMVDPSKLSPDMIKGLVK